jgi:hypothetical protein
MPESRDQKTPLMDSEQGRGSEQNLEPHVDDKEKREASLRMGAFRHDHTAEPAKVAEEEAGDGNTR